MQAPYAPDVKVHLVLSGDFDPDEVTRVTGLKPTSVRRRGDPTGESLGRAREDSWRITLGPVATMDGTAQLVEMLDRIEPVSGALRQLAELRGLSIGLTLVAYVPPHYASAVPNVALDHSLLRRLADLGVDLEFDFALLGSDNSA